MTVDEICALPIAELAANDAVLLLWATWPELFEAAPQVIAAWGFEYVTGFPWVKLSGDPRRNLNGDWEYKPQYGTGFWVRGCTEPVLVCKRGKAKPHNAGNFCGISTAKLPPQPQAGKPLRVCRLNAGAVPGTIRATRATR